MRYGAGPKSIDEFAAALLGVAPRPRSLARGRELVWQGDAPQALHVLLAGHVGRHQTLQLDRRQITAILVPGDLCDLDAALQGKALCGVVALTDCIVGEVPLSHIRQHPRLSELLLSQLRCEEAIARQWIVNLGARRAVERLAHLLCELHLRLLRRDLADKAGFELQLRQLELADALGLSLVQANRVLGQLRATGMIHLKGRLLTIVDLPALRRFAQFDPSYLDAAPTSAALPAAPA